MVVKSNGILPNPPRDIGCLIGNVVGIVKFGIKYAFWGAVFYFGYKTVACTMKTLKAEQVKPTTEHVYVDRDYIDRKVEVNKQSGLPGELEQITEKYVN